MIGVNGVRFGLTVHASQNVRASEKYQPVLADLAAHQQDDSTRGVRLTIVPRHLYHRDQIKISLPKQPPVIVKKMPLETVHHWSKRALGKLQKALADKYTAETTMVGGEPVFTTSQRVFRQLREQKYMQASTLTGSQDWPPQATKRKGVRH